MKREVVGFSRMAEELLSQELETAPFFFASPHNSMLGVGIEQQLDQAIPFSELALRANQMLEQVKKSENDNPVLFAIVPFDEKTPTKFGYLHSRVGIQP